MNETRTQKLNELFAEWKQRTGEEAKRMCLDGIVCEDNYERVKPKLLFVAKEPNNPEGQGVDLRKAFSKVVKYTFSKRLCEWAYGVWNCFPLSGPPILDHFRCELGGSRRADSLGLGQIHRVFYIRDYYGVVAGCTGADSPRRRRGLRRSKRRFLA